jgi:hypothetical protein
LRGNVDLMVTFDHGRKLKGKLERGHDKLHSMAPLAKSVVPHQAADLVSRPRSPGVLIRAVFKAGPSPPDRPPAKS